ncbi:hypothetical protein [Streptomyces sp. NPDC057694]|uniref:hypothetical protein n=1 Tax=Streptomyces sp. NPDC057694 TaxID=3346216 RepID=UPI0036845C23
MTRTSTDTSAYDHCPVCHEPISARTQWWKLKSRHRTSRGEIEYCLGGCGCLVILVDGEMIKAVSMGTTQRGDFRNGAEAVTPPAHAITPQSRRSGDEVADPG